MSYSLTEAERVQIIQKNQARGFVWMEEFDRFAAPGTIFGKETGVGVYIDGKKFKRLGRMRRSVRHG